ncbi:MAG: hypothetical protein SXU28_04060 [Pseudomonadota bacterium]|nr:hypothetical protein [Pseudomonadota bacterium]
MANGFLGGSKGALIFAGGVIACSALVAMSMGSQFTPKSESGYTADRGVAPPPVTKTGDSAAPAPQQQQQEAVFGEFAGFADDAELIDDTSGFDPSPGQETAIILDNTGDDNNGFASDSSAAAAASNVGTIVKDTAPAPTQVGKPKAVAAPIGQSRGAPTYSIPLSDLRKNPNYGKADRPQKRPE